MTFTSDEVELIKDNNFKQLLTQEIVADISKEQILSNLRKKCCLLSVEDKLDNSLISFLECLSCQCLLTEYVYEEDYKELEIIKLLVNRCKKSEHFYYIPIIACYKHLSSLLDEIPYIKDYPTQTKESKIFLQHHIEEPLEELKLLKSIETIGDITNFISQKVKNQYEINPYPRWSKTYTDDKVLPIEYMIQYFVCDGCKNLTEFKNPKILIAGCGTGIHVINYRGYNVDTITAIDLSKKSLSFAKRKTIEYGMNNVKFFEMDILNLHLLDEKYDVIECTGVLNHMENPEEGLSKLVKCLSPNGYMKLGMYSKIARNVISQAHSEIKKFKYDSTSDGIKKFRKEIIFGSLNYLNKITQTVDFYSLSTCRDLCFHVHEKTFSIKEINSLLNLNKLKFCGFDLPDNVKNTYRHLFPNDLQLINLNNWEIFELHYPDTFLCMYQFWVKFKNY